MTMTLLHISQIRNLADGERIDACGYGKQQQLLRRRCGVGGVLTHLVRDLVFAAACHVQSRVSRDGREPRAETAALRVKLRKFFEYTQIHLRNAVGDCRAAAQYRRRDIAHKRAVALLQLRHAALVALRDELHYLEVVHSSTSP